ncbi:hypothetical protein HanXRQr2_Chr03g0116441 [Helianthus annuus]|uniref:Uncharacterized protein n=1 Tax=Helianthus annuus TaxID=4232 RepID=A0A251V7B6_HELAN|nr:uncharacterized protein LOC110929644 [Helianthus annuus]KAF5814908.1 hypothetical protein HanXRQr2_Chr03g0116441 [Helianthus annuus]KAJ0593467.1 hypothetical protein HanHA300_Chr03g0097261 [Helianthus annuus]KAJ0608478.1 hypothetical protein HanHA89_Chr03g0108951 [Helianthus annuus]KAJ0768541.1 hypothetical protein HanLR1_Chr03g0102311 [Helianthus annuus]KAJ0774291.1 hypothetical protein HanOQP8_Chr03g0109831 [Helianthus annuus]
MGFWDAVYYTGDLIKGITPSLSTVKHAGSAACSYTYAAVTKIDQVVRVDGIEKLPQYWPDDEKRAQIGLFTTTLAKNAGKYAVCEGFKHIPGATVASKLASDTMREVKQQNHKDGLKSVQAKMDKLEKDLMKSTSQPEILDQNGNLSSANAIEGGSETKDMINTFMKTEFVGNHMFRDLMVPKIARIENTNE